MMNIDVPDIEMDEVYEEGEREGFPPQEFEAEEDSHGAAAPVNSSDDEDGEPAEKKIKSKSAAKKIVKNPQAKLDDMRLCGQRGIPLLPKTFRDVKFKGKGHEVEDLDLYLSKMEHWAHRMFPKMVFDEVVERCDRLYKTKKLVKTTLIRIRNSENLLDDDNVDEDDVAREGDVARESDDEVDRNDLDDEPPRDVTDFVPPASPPPPPPTQINAEMRERIERNKRLAMEKRMARLQAQREQEAAEASDATNESSTPTATASTTPLPSATVPTHATTVPSPTASGPLHSMPAVVSKAATPTVVALRKEGTAATSSRMPNSDEVEEETTDSSRPSLRRDIASAAEGDEATTNIAEGGSSQSESEQVASEAAPNASPPREPLRSRNEPELEEDELLKLINDG